MESRILIVDDSRSIRHQLRKILEQAENAQFQIVDVEDGLQALHYLNSVGASELPDLILLDRNMPQMTGDEVLQIIKADEVLKHIPVLILTAQIAVQELVKGLADLGAEDYLRKPCDPQELLVRIKVLIRVKRAEERTRQLNHDLIAALAEQVQAFEELKLTKVRLAETEAMAQMSKIFQKFVPLQFLKRIATEGIESIRLGNVGSESLTVLFCDIRSFTQLSEIMTPREVYNFLNSYLSRMLIPIETHGGFVDKFIGDAIMALFEHADKSHQVNNALSAAISMQEEVKIYNQHRDNCGYEAIKIGVGIHVGHVMIGTLGNDNRMDSTVLGDSVNVASRLENLTKFYGCAILVSEEVFQNLDTSTMPYWRELDFVSLKGRKQPLVIYEIFINDETFLRETKLKTQNIFHHALKQFQTCQWDNAMESFQQCLEFCPQDPVPTIFLERCHKFKLNPPASDWDGSITLDFK